MLKDVLVVIDVQYGLQKAYHFDQLVHAINQRIAAYHQAHHPVIFVQHNDDTMVYGNHDWQLVANLQRQANDRVILKYHSDPFFQTGLAAVLHDFGANTVEVCGLQTEYCIDSSLRVGHDLGFQMAIIQSLDSTLDAPDLTAQQIIQHHEHIWDGTFAEVLPKTVLEADSQ